MQGVGKCARDREFVETHRLGRLRAQGEVSMKE